MGEFSASDCSWKKMVIAKSDNEWTSTIKSEVPDTNTLNSTHSTNFSLQDDSFGNIKKEIEEVNIDESCQISEDVEEQPVTMVLDIDPHLVEQVQPRRRRGSGPRPETPNSRAIRLAKMSAYAAERLACESPDQRAVRLKRMSEYAAKRLARETSEQRAKRLARMSAYAAKRLAKETPEQRQARLSRMSAYAARRHASKKLINPSTTNDTISDNCNHLS